MNDHAVETGQQQQHQQEDKEPLLTQQCRKLYGREEEVHSLRSLISESQNGVQLTFVDGASGSGKTALIHEAYSSSSDKDGRLLVGYGKFKVLESPGSGNGKPFAALSQSLADFAAQLTNEKTAKQLQALRQAVRDKLTDPCDQDILVELCSDFEGLFPTRNNSNVSFSTLKSSATGNDETRSTSTGSSELSSAWMSLADGDPSSSTDNLEYPSAAGFSLLKNVLRHFFQALTSQHEDRIIIVWVLDDLQWIDDTSFAVVKSTLEDPQLTRNMVFAGSYRTKDLARNKAVQEWVEGRSISSNRTPTKANTTRISLGPLSEEYVHELLSDLLRVTPHQQQTLQPDDVILLSSLINNRTDGKVFFVLQLVDYLQAENMICYADRRWKWDVDEIEEHLNELAAQAAVDEDDDCNGMMSSSSHHGNAVNDSTSALGVHIVLTRLRNLPQHIQHGLQVAACLGFVFEPRMLQVALQEPQSGSVFSCSSLEFLQTALQLHLVEEASSDPLTYRFTHDKIYEMSLHLKTCHGDEKTDRRSLLYWNIGKAIWNHWLAAAVDAPTLHPCLGGVEKADTAQSHKSRGQPWKSVEDRIIFVCTDLLNRGKKWLQVPSSSDPRLNNDDNTMRMHMVLLNLEVGQRSSSKNAFVPAMEYLRTAVDLLDTNKTSNVGTTVRSVWETHYTLMNDLHTLLAEVCLCCGRLDAIPPIVEAALAHQEKDNPLGVFRIQYVALQRLVMTNQLSKLIDESLALLAQFLEGETFSKTPPDSVVNRRRKQIMARLAKVTDEDIRKLPKLKDTQKLAAVKIIANIVAHVQYFSQLQGMTEILHCRAVEITLDYGLSKYSSNCFAYCAFVLFDDTKKTWFDASIRLSKLAVMLAKERGGNDWRKEISPDALVFRHWTQPYVSDVDDAFSIYQEELKRGHLATAFQAVVLYLYSYYYSGLGLGPIVDDTKTICAIKMEYGQHLRLLHMLPFYQVILNLTGQSDDILDMHNGTAMEYRKILGCGETYREGDLSQLSQWAFSLQLYVYCENWTLANDIYGKLVDKPIGFMRPLPMWHNRVFFFALIAIHNAKKTAWHKRAKLKREVEKHMSLMRLWVLKRNSINLVHKLQLLEAEMLTMQRQYPSDQVLVCAYDKAIQNATRPGYVQDAALSAAFAARAVRDPVKQEDYALLAQDSYKKWGALGLVNYLQSTSDIHKRAAERAQLLKAHFGLKSRQRFDRDITQGHKRLSLDAGNEDFGQVNERNVRS